MKMTDSVKSFGTTQEGSLHSALKQWYMLPGDKCEVTVDGYFIDIVRGELLIEIQTQNFAAIKHKITKLIENRQVRVVYPIPLEKSIVHFSRWANNSWETKITKI